MTKSNKRPLPVHIPTVLKGLLEIWWLPLLFAVLGAFSGIFLALVFGKQTYRCRAIFLYIPKHLEDVTIESLSLETHISLIKLPDNLRSMGTMLGVRDKDVAASFDVIVSKKEGMVTFVVNSDDPEKAFHFMEVITQVFLNAQVQKRKSHALEYISAFEHQYKQALIDLKKSEEDAEEFIRKNKIIDISQEKKWYLEKLVSLDLELQRLSVEASAVTLKLGKMQGIIAKLEKKMQQEQKIQKLQGESLTQLSTRKERLLELIAEAKQRDVLEKELQFYRLQLAKLEESSENVSDTEIETVKNKIEIILARLEDTQQVKAWKKELENIDTTLVPNSDNNTPSSLILKEILSQLFTLELEEAAANNKVKKYQEHMATVEKHLAQVADLQERYNSLQRKVQINLSTVKRYKALMEGSRLLTQLEKPDFLQVSAPTIPTRASKSNKKLIAIAVAALFTMFGVGLGLILAAISLAVRSGGEAQARFNIPLMAEFADDSKYRNPGMLARLFKRLSKRVARSKRFQRSVPNVGNDLAKFRSLAMNLSPHISHSEKGWSIAIMDPNKNNGKQICQNIALGISFCMVRMGYDTLVVDCRILSEQDFRLAAVLGKPKEAVLQAAKERDICVEFGHHQDRQTAYISCYRNHGYINSEKSLSDFLDIAKANYSLLLLLAPLPEFEADFRLCSRIAEGGILAMQAGAEPFWRYLQPLKIFQEEKTPMLGLIVTGVRRPFIS